MKRILVLIMLVMSFSNADLVDDGFAKMNFGDKKGAITDWTKACNNGNSKGCYNLGVMYGNGDGVKRDTKKAKFFILKHVIMDI